MYPSMERQHLRILAISGSLRTKSANTALVHLAAQSAPEGIEVVIYNGLAGLPHFNPDLDREPAHPSVSELRANVEASDALLISVPEYAHGVPGSLKNALDWLVGSGELLDKPVAVINASPRSTHAFASLVETLTVMSAVVVRDASIVLPFTPDAADVALRSEESKERRVLRRAMQALVAAVDRARAAM